MTISESLRRFFDELPQNLIEQNVVDHIVREVDDGRLLEDILNDPYVKNRLTDSARTAIFDNPDIAEAVAREVRDSFDDMKL